jgi:hypothetical protein
MTEPKPVRRRDDRGAGVAFFLGSGQQRQVPAQVVDGVGCFECAALGRRHHVTYAYVDSGALAEHFGDPEGYVDE